MTCYACNRISCGKCRLWAMVAVVAVVLWLASVLQGCGGAIGAQAGAIRTTAVVLEGVVNTVEAAYQSELDACADALCVDAAEERYSRVEFASEAAILALRYWIDAVDVVRAAGGDDAPPVIWRQVLAAIERLVTGWNALVESGRGIGIDLPAIPTAVLAFVGR